MMQEIDKRACEEFLEERWDNMLWSVSNLSSFDHCQYSWYCERVLGIRKGNFHAYVGTSLHEIMEDYYNYVLGGGSVDLVTMRLALSNKLTSKLLKNPYANEVSKTIRNGSYRKVLESLWYHEPISGVTAVERKVLFEVGGYEFVGLIDLDTPLWHYDWKSTWNEKKYGRQQALYMYAKEQIDGTKVKGYRIPQYKKNMDIVEVERFPPDINTSVEWVEYTIPKIRKALETGEFRKNPNDSFFCTSLCSSETCEFRNKL